MSFQRDEQILSTAEAILRYLEKRPDAAETVDGVAHWWLLRQRYEDSRLVVQQALEYLETSGCVSKTVSNDGRVYYRCANPSPLPRKGMN